MKKRLKNVCTNATFYIIFALQYSTSQSFTHSILPTMRIMHQGSTAYQYTHNGVDFIVQRINGGVFNNIPKWYIEYKNMPDVEVGFKTDTKKQAIELAKSLIDKKYKFPQ